MSRRVQLVRRYHSRQVVLHVECFYNQLCEPLDETESRIRETGSREDTKFTGRRETWQNQMVLRWTPSVGQD